MDLSDISQIKLNAVARQLNARPRKTLDYETPAENGRYKGPLISTTLSQVRPGFSILIQFSLPT
jgi:hypothetical protein